MVASEPKTTRSVPRRRMIAAHHCALSKPHHRAADTGRVEARDQVAGRLRLRFRARVTAMLSTRLG
jgi:hypothetical protein